MIGANDLFIAAHARNLSLRLVTNNLDEFQRVKDLTLENWTTRPVRRTLATDDKSLLATTRSLDSDSVYTVAISRLRHSVQPPRRRRTRFASPALSMLTRSS